MSHTSSRLHCPLSMTFSACEMYYTLPYSSRSPTCPFREKQPYENQFYFAADHSPKHRLLAERPILRANSLRNSSHQALEVTISANERHEDNPPSRTLTLFFLRYRDTASTLHTKSRRASPLPLRLSCSFFVVPQMAAGASRIGTGRRSRKKKRRTACNREAAACRDDPTKACHHSAPRGLSLDGLRCRHPARRCLRSL